LFPQVREHGALRRATWDEALAAAVLSLDRLRSQGVPLGVIGSGRASNEENFLAVALARTALHTGTLDAALRGCYEALAPLARIAGGAPHDPTAFAQLEGADVVVVIEGDVATSHPRIATSILRALRRGSRLVTVGWHHSELTRLADAHVMLGAAAPLDALQALQRALHEAVQQTPGAAKVEGVTAEIGAAASVLARARQAAFVLAPFDANPALLAAIASLVAALTDDLVVGGGGKPLILPLPVRANTRGALDMGVTPHLLPGRFPLDDAGARERLRALWGGTPNWTAGVGFDAMLGDVRGLVVFADDPAASHRWPSHAASALASLDALVVCDSYVTGASRAAHVVLPIAAFGESTGSVTSLEGRVQQCQECVVTPGEVRAGWRVLSDLLKGLGATYQPTSLDDVHRGIQRAIPQYAACDASGMMRNGGVRVGAVDRDILPPAPRKSQAAHLPSVADAPTPAGAWRLRYEGAFDWGDDPVVLSSPLLRRSTQSARKRHPDGVVAMNAADAEALGVREGWRVHLRSANGEAEVAVTLRPAQERGTLFVPYAHRERVAPVANGAEVVEVDVRRA
jgi:predicted molibdopterin-dependent oxidoreductase YjgC